LFVQTSLIHQIQQIRPASQIIKEIIVVDFK